MRKLAWYMAAVLGIVQIHQQWTIFSIKHRTNFSPEGQDLVNVIGYTAAFTALLPCCLLVLLFLIKNKDSKILNIITKILAILTIVLIGFFEWWLLNHISSDDYSFLLPAIAFLPFFVFCFKLLFDPGPTKGYSHLK